MKQVVQRLLIFFIGFPLFVGVVILLPHFNHVVFNILVVIFSAGAAFEFSAMLAKKNYVIPKAEAAVLGSLLPLGSLLHVAFGVHFFVIPALFTLAVVWLLASRSFAKAAMLESFASRLVSGFAVTAYPGSLLVWIILLSNFTESASLLILMFLGMVFTSDGGAWLTGVLFGKNNKGVVAASPNKSVAGFFGGIICPVIFSEQHPCKPSAAV
jgi:phosphatidate cytidylyltransferase